MEDREFLNQLKQKVEGAAGFAIELTLDESDRRKLSVDFGGPVPKVTFGADVLQYPGLARMFSQFAILCLKQRRQVTELEFLLFLRRN